MSETSTWAPAFKNFLYVQLPLAFLVFLVLLALLVLVLKIINRKTDAEIKDKNPAIRVSNDSNNHP